MLFDKHAAGIVDGDQDRATDVPGEVMQRGQHLLVGGALWAACASHGCIAIARLAPDALGRGGVRECRAYRRCARSRGRRGGRMPWLRPKMRIGVAVSSVRPGRWAVDMTDLKNKDDTRGTPVSGRARHEPGTESEHRGVQRNVNGYFDSEAVYWDAVYRGEDLQGLIYRRRQAAVLDSVDAADLRPGAAVLRSAAAPVISPSSSPSAVCALRRWTPAGRWPTPPASGCGRLGLLKR